MLRSYRLIGREVGHRGSVRWGCAVALLLAAGWTAPSNITNLGVREVGPRIAADGSGNLHLVWYGGTDPDDADHWKVWYQVYNGSSWIVRQEISGSGAGSPDIAVDGAGNVHVVWHQGNPAEIFYRRKTASGWESIQQLSSTSGKGLIPRVACDPTGNHVLVVWHEDFRPATHFEIVAMKNTNGTWGAMENVSNDPSLSRNANVAIDASGTFHIAWEDPEVNHAYYRSRSVAGVYSGKVSLDNSSGRSYGPDVAVGGDGRVHFAWHEDPDSWEIYYRSVLGGVWTSAIDLSNIAGETECCANIGIDADDQAWVVWHDYNNIYVSRQIGGTFQPWFRLTDGEAQTGPVITFTPSNASHIVWEAFRTTPTGTRDIYWSWRTNPDTTPPVPVNGVTAEASNQQVRLDWTNPNAIDFVGTRIRVRTDQFPTGPFDGQLVQDESGPRGTSDGYTQTGLTNGVMYYYALFAFDDSGNYSVARTINALPSGPADFDRDGDVDQDDFGAFQACMTGMAVPQPDPICEPGMLDGDEDVDGDDLLVFLNCAMGAGIPASPACAD